MHYLSFFIALLIATSQLLAPLARADETTYLVGVVPQYEARRLHAIWRPILDRLEQSTGFRFRFRGSPSIPDFERDFLSGEFDFAYMNPYHLVIAHEQQGYIPLVRDVGRTLHGVLVVRKDSGITTPEELDGSKIAFPAPNALGASLQMRQELHDQFNIKPVPHYVKTHDSVYLNVVLGQAAAGGGVQKTLNRQQADIRDSLRIIHSTTPVAPHPFAAHPRVPQQVNEAVQNGLLQLGGESDGAAMLANIPIRKIGVSTIDDYLPLQSMGLERFYVKPQ